MPPLSPYLADKNSLAFRGYKLCVEFLYDNSPVDPADWLYYRRAMYDQDLTLTLDQLGNPGTNVTAVFTGGTPIGDTEEQQDLATSSSQMTLVLPNAAREMQSICEFFDLDSMPGRLLWVHPDYLSDGAVVESVFQIETVAPVREHAAMTVTPYSFNPTTKLLPAEVITPEKWPGVAGIRARFLL